MTVIFVGYQRRFSAHKEGLGEVQAPSLGELRAKLAAAHGGAEFRLALCRGARVEVARRRGRPIEVGWT
jgi:hypothetical protein